MGSGKGGSDAANKEADLMEKEYQENELEKAEQTKELDKEEMGFLHSQGGVVFQNVPAAPIGSISPEVGE